jgi:diguanylate cyclase (GGDEF)-like protein
MSVATLNEPVQPRRRATPRLVATLALFVLTLVLFCGIVGAVLVQKADDQQELERRSALLGAVEDLRASGADLTSLDPRAIRSMERTAGLKDLRFETDPVQGDREIQSVLDRQGRIIGWFSWEPDRSLSNALSRLNPLLAATGFLLAFFSIFALWQVRRAVHDLGSSEQRAWRLAHEDMLTGLPNHRKMIEMIDATLAGRIPQEVVTLALIDLDGLNDVNDTMGHHAGDTLIVELAKRLMAALPEGADGGRFDGDEFAVLMTSPNAEYAEAAIRAITSVLAKPLWMNDQAVQIDITTGLAHAPQHALSRDDLNRRADLALRTAKRNQRGSLVVFKPSMDADFNDRRFIERELKRALTDQLLDVHYQPIVSSDGSHIVGAEALLRWTHAVRGQVPPAVFVPVAEQAGLMGKLGEFVLRRALTDAKRWPDLYIAVNLSPVQVRDQGLVDLVTTILNETGLSPDRLMLEVTEGVLIENPEDAKTRLGALQKIGVKLALDDFGTGYSSLTYLQTFSFDKLKIDKGFVEPLGQPGNSQAMIQAIVALGRAMNLTILAEGVETEEQRVLLRLAGCDEMQGFLFARPASRETLDRLLAMAAADRTQPGFLELRTG